MYDKENKKKNIDLASKNIKTKINQQSRDIKVTSIWYTA